MDGTPERRALLNALDAITAEYVAAFRGANATYTGLMALVAPYGFNFKVQSRNECTFLELAFENTDVKLVMTIGVHGQLHRDSDEKLEFLVWFQLRVEFKAPYPGRWTLYLTNIRSLDQHVRGEIPYCTWPQFYTGSLPKLKETVAINFLEATAREAVEASCRLARQIMDDQDSPPLSAA